MEQKIITPSGDYKELDEWLDRAGKAGILLVCGGSIQKLDIWNHLENARKRGAKLIRFSDFQPNPQYESVVKGVEMFRGEECRAILGVGGGSAMDVAKCIKLFADMDGDGRDGGFLRQEIVPNKIPFLAMPTTAGTGSEATRYAVIYYRGAKQSVTHVSCIPETVLMDPGVLKSLPDYQKKATMMDAFCHALESFWSVNSTSESKSFSRSAIRGVLAHMDGYLANSDAGNAGMMQAAYTAGQAINITQTTAGHAMCYKLTGMYHLSHGHAAALCDRVLFPHMIRNTGKCIDPRGESYLCDTLQEIADAMDCPTPDAAAGLLNEIITKLALPAPDISEEDYALLRDSVNTVRLKNHPVSLDPETIEALYREISR